MHELIKNRRSVRDFTDKPVEPEKITRILRAAMQAPSARNKQPWEFLVVRNKDTLAAIAQSSPAAAPAGRGDVCIIPLVNMDYAGADSPWFAQDLGACTENILLQTVDEGLGAVWMGCYPLPDRQQTVRTLCNLPDHILPFAIIAIGYPKEHIPFIDRFDETRIHYELY